MIQFHPCLSAMSVAVGRRSITWEEALTVTLLLLPLLVATPLLSCG